MTPVLEGLRVLELGQVSAAGTAEQIAADPRLVESYLGLGGGDY